VSLAGRLTLKQLAALLKRAVLFVGNDSAPMHMAQAVRTPVIALFGPSGVHNWGPRGERDRVIFRTWACVPCGRDGCAGSKRSRCLEDIAAAEVIQAVEALLGTGAQPGRPG
jgi:heptosyltransferase III